MDNSGQNRPPLDVEAAIDLVLAAAAHRSNNARHSEFGKLLIDQYFVQIREAYKDDPIATRYLNNLLAAAAAAIRGFSVERDMFGTRWESLLEQKRYGIERANRLSMYSPFAEKNIWGTLVGILGGAGFGGILGEVAKTYLVPSNLLVGSAMIGAAALGPVLFEVFLDRYRDHRLNVIAHQFPDSLRMQWEQQSLTSYRLIIKRFLISALKIREEFYPHLTSIQGSRIFETYHIPHINFVEQASLGKEALANTSELDQIVDEIVDRHFAFK